MHYLVLTVDPFGIPLHAKGDFPKSNWPVVLPDKLRLDILAWNEKFSKLISSEDKFSTDDLAKLRRELNSIGHQLAEKITVAVEDVRVEFLPE